MMSALLRGCSPISSVDLSSQFEVSVGPSGSDLTLPRTNSGYQLCAERGPDTDSPAGEKLKSTHAPNEVLGLMTVAGSMSGQHIMAAAVTRRTSRYEGREVSISAYSLIAFKRPCELILPHDFRASTLIPMPVPTRAE